MTTAMLFLDGPLEGQTIAHVGSVAYYVVTHPAPLLPLRAANGDVVTKPPAELSTYTTTYHRVAKGPEIQVMSVTDNRSAWC